MVTQGTVTGKKWGLAGCSSERPEPQRPSMETSPEPHPGWPEQQGEGAHSFPHRPRSPFGDIFASFKADFHASCVLVSL